MARRATAAEKRVLRSWFPQLNVDGIWVTGNATPTYNCLAWVLGITNSWVWPWGNRNASKREMDAFMRVRGYAPSPAGQIAAYGPYGAVGHVARVSGGAFQSKLGSYLRITHGLWGLTGGVYGGYAGSYGYRGFAAEGLAATDGTEEVSVTLSDDERAALKKQVDAVGAPTRRAFAKAFDAWKASWSSPEMAWSSNPGDYARGPDYLAVLALGEAAVPLIVERLADAENFLALSALDALTPAGFLAVPELDDPAVLEGEQARAEQAVRFWIASQA